VTPMLNYFFRDILVYGFMLTGDNAKKRILLVNRRRANLR
jgi:hypothetical protein